MTPGTFADAFKSWSRLHWLPVCLAVFPVACQKPGDLHLNRRIDQNPVMFNQKSYQEKLLITDGQIGKGMTRDAVFLAWGKPKAIFEGVEESGYPYEEWVYEKIKPTPEFSLGAGLGGLFSPGITLDSSFIKSVIFRDGRVFSFRVRKK